MSYSLLIHKFISIVSTALLTTAFHFSWVLSCCHRKYKYVQSEHNADCLHTLFTRITVLVKVSAVPKQPCMCVFVRCEPLFPELIRNRYFPPVSFFLLGSKCGSIKLWEKCTFCCSSWNLFNLVRATQGHLCFSLSPPLRLPLFLVFFSSSSLWIITHLCFTTDINQCFWHSNVYTF